MATAGAAHSEEVGSVLRSQATKSDKIRALERLGLPRARIADALQVKYQFVRNVLEADRLRDRSRPLRSAEQTRSATRVGNLFRLPVGPGGTLALPGDVLDRLGAREGGVVIADLDGERFTLLSATEAMHRAQALVPQWRPGEPLASDELIADRRQEAAGDSDG